MVKRRHEESAVAGDISARASGPQPLVHVNLPPDLWARALEYSYFDEVVMLTAVSKSLLDDVPPQLKQLWVRTGKSMDVMPAAIERFSNVKDVEVHSLIEEVSNDATSGNKIYHVDDATIDNVIPFLSKLPRKLECFIGGLSKNKDQAVFLCDGSGVYYQHQKISYDFKLSYDSPDSNMKMAQLIQRASQAYLSGKLSENVFIRGLIPFKWQDMNQCAWRGMPKLSCYRNDVPCQICDMICHSFPPLQVMKLDDYDIPCISMQNRLLVAGFRGGDRNSSYLMTVFLEKIEEGFSCSYPAMLPPDHLNSCRAIYFEQGLCQQMNALILMGVDVKDTRIRGHIVSDSNRENLPMFLETYNRLKGLGLDINEGDFLLVDESDRRTNYSLYCSRKAKAELDPNAARQAKEQLSSELGASLPALERKVKRVVEAHLARSGLLSFTSYGINMCVTN